MFRRVSIFIGIAFLLSTAVLPVHADADKRDVKVMTRNMDAGTDLQWFFVTDVVTATTLTFNEVLASNIPGRAALLADEIGSEMPDLIGLQEVALWEAGSAGGPATVVLDQLD